MIKLIVGPMFGGKSTELLRQLTRAKIAGKRVVLLRPKKDTRGFVTHSKLDHEFVESFESRISDFTDWPQFDVIGVDEGQFFDNLRDDAVRMSFEGKVVIIAGLNGTSEKKPFQQIQDLIPFVDSIDFKPAVCVGCGNDAAFSYYKGGKKDCDVLVGGSNQYVAVCGKCYNFPSLSWL